MTLGSTVVMVDHGDAVTLALSDWQSVTSAFAGLQINRENAQGETVEHFLEDALFKARFSSHQPLINLFK